MQRMTNKAYRKNIFFTQDFWSIKYYDCDPNDYKFNLFIITFEFQLSKDF